MAIRVIGANCSLSEAVIDKLLSMDIDVIASEDSHEHRNKALLQYSNVRLLKEGEGYSISFDGSEADLIVGKHIKIHDLLPTRNDRWMPSEILSWVEGEDVSAPARYWVSVSDVASAIAIIVGEEISIDSVNLCGRRKWSPFDSKAEFDMLWQRTQQGQSGLFTSEVLFGHEISGMEAKPITANEDIRPDLEPIQELLIQITGEGWRPLVPFRTGLMQLIAGILENK